MNDWCRAIDGGIRLRVQISPNAKTTEAGGTVGNALKLRLQARPIEGRANEALIHYLAQILSVPRNAVRITHGLSARRKQIDILASGVTPELARKLLLVLRE